MKTAAIPDTPIFRRKLGNSCEVHDYVLAVAIRAAVGTENSEVGGRILFQYDLQRIMNGCSDSPRPCGEQVFQSVGVD